MSSPTHSLYIEYHHLSLYTATPSTVEATAVSPSVSGAAEKWQVRVPQDVPDGPKEKMCVVDGRSIPVLKENTFLV